MNNVLFQGDPVFVPVKFAGSDKSSGNESDDSATSRGRRSVRFSKLSEVRSMSESEAHDAMMSRLSYQASLRAQEAKTRAANKLNVSQTAYLACLFCLLVIISYYTFY